MITTTTTPTNIHITTPIPTIITITTHHQDGELPSRQFRRITGRGQHVRVFIFVVDSSQIRGCVVINKVARARHAYSGSRVFEISLD